MDNEKVNRIFSKDKFALASGITLISIGDGEASASVNVEEKHYNGVGIVQGGLIFTLADFAFAAASNSRGRTAVAVRCDISYIKPVKGGTLTASAKEVSCGNKISNYRVKINDCTGDLVAVFNGTAYRKDDNNGN